MSPKKPRKRKPAKEAKKRISETGRAFLMETMAEVTSLDQATFALITFMAPDEDMPEPFRSNAAKALMKFAHVGWAAFHQLEFKKKSEAIDKAAAKAR